MRGRRTIGAWALALLLAGSAAAAEGGAGAGREGRNAMAEATFAGGCFWCMEPPFDKVPGVESTTVGYTGGHTRNPTYEETSSGTTGHAEAIRVVYDPAKVAYAQLLDVFWRNVDPLTPNAQFCDHGSQYRSAVFYHDEAQRKAAEDGKRALEKERGWRIVTEVVPAQAFWPAEEYHQDYYRKNPVRYRFYRFNCGRDRRLRELWGSAAGSHED